MRFYLIDAGKWISINYLRMGDRIFLTQDQILELLENGNTSDLEGADGEDEDFTSSFYAGLAQEANIQIDEDMLIEAQVENLEDTVTHGDAVEVVEEQPVVENENLGLVEAQPAQQVDEVTVNNTEQPLLTYQNSMSWKKATFRKKRIIREDPILGSNYYQENSRRNWIPMTYFSQYISNEIVEKLAYFTNIRSVQDTGSSINVTASEMRVFLGVNIYMATVGLPRIRMFWAADTRVPQVADAITRDRYCQIRKHLKIINDLDVTPDMKRNDVLWKVRPLLDAVRNGCLQLVRLNRLSIDEQIIPFQGKSQIKQYVKGKPNPIGLKNFVLADENGLVLDFHIYQGKGTYRVFQKSGDPRIFFEWLKMGT
ncbi:hypothetical protein M8J77_002108 [Diaphorina citri]|nr:hypothetical protein M8J77_002108 [Diaphorina citri]